VLIYRSAYWIFDGTGKEEGRGGGRRKGQTIAVTWLLQRKGKNCYSRLFLSTSLEEKEKEEGPHSKIPQKEKKREHQCSKLKFQNLWGGREDMTIIVFSGSGLHLFCSTSGEGGGGKEGKRKKEKGEEGHIRSEV